MSRRMAFLHLPPIRWLTSFYNPPTKLVPIFDQNILKGSHIENAWSGKDTRGHIQFNGNSMHAIETDTDYHINIMPKDDFKKYIDMLIRQ